MQPVLRDGCPDPEWNTATRCVHIWADFMKSFLVYCVSASALYRTNDRFFCVIWVQPVSSLELVWILRCSTGKGWAGSAPGRKLRGSVRPWEPTYPASQVLMRWGSCTALSERPSGMHINSCNTQHVCRSFANVPFVHNVIMFVKK